MQCLHNASDIFETIGECPSIRNQDFLDVHYEISRTRHLDFCRSVICI